MVKEIQGGAMNNMICKVMGIAAGLIVLAGFAFAGVEDTERTFYGYDAGASNTSGYGNTFIGTSAGYDNTTGHYNICVGRLAGYSGNGNENVFIGHETGYHSTGDENVFIGRRAGFASATGYGNVFIGKGAGSAETGSNRLYIDNCYKNSGASEYLCEYPLIYGEFDNRIVKINGALMMTAVLTPSDIRLKKEIEPLKSSLERVIKLQGVSYSWKAVENPGRGFSSGRNIGLIAQDVEKVIPEVVYTDGKGIKALSYDKLAPVFVEAMKEQQKIISNLTEKLERLEAELKAVKARKNDNLEISAY
jgi:trimeric autotransporter adhesin